MDKKAPNSNMMDSDTYSPGTIFYYMFPLLLWYCWFNDRKDIWHAKKFCAT